MGSMSGSSRRHSWVQQRENCQTSILVQSGMGCTISTASDQDRDRHTLSFGQMCTQTDTNSKKIHSF